MAKDVLHKLAPKAALPILDKFLQKQIKKGALKAGKGFTLFISNEDMDDIIKIKKSLEDSGLLVDGATETVKHEIKKQEGGFLGAMTPHIDASLIAPTASSLIQPVTSPLINAIIGKVVMRAGKGEEGGFLPLLAIPLLLKVLGKGVARVGRGYNSINHMDKSFQSHPIL